MTTRNVLKFISGERSLSAQDCFQWFLFILKLYWIFTKSSVKNKIRVNTSSAYRVILYNIKKEAPTGGVL